MAAIGVSEVYPDLSGVKALKSLTAQKRVVLKAVRAGAKVAAAAIKARAPRRKGRGGGATRQSIGIKAEKGRRGKSLAFAVIGARFKVKRDVPHGLKTRKHVPALIAHILEKGAKPHSLKKRKGAGARQNPGRHPGAQAKPFIGPGWSAAKAPAVKVARDVLAAEIDKETRKEWARVTRSKGRR